MAQIELKMPKMGESVHEATIIRWLKNEGETIEADESLLEIATDKVDSEVPSPSSKVVKSSVKLYSSLISKRNILKARKLKLKTEKHHFLKLKTNIVLPKIFQL